jgi:hypothetical protein
MSARATPLQEQPGLASFLQGLVANGSAVVFNTACGSVDDASFSILEEIDTRAREELGLEAPAFSPAVAAWSAVHLYNACRFAVCRDIGAPEIRAAFAVACPEPRGPETDWSADLLFRHLPQVYRLARHLSNADPLVVELQQLCTTWPLSSVGVNGLPTMDLGSFIQHPGLRRLYADRILTAGDLTRIGHSLLDDLLRMDLGTHRELAPEFAAKLFPETNNLNSGSISLP